MKGIVMDKFPAFDLEDIEILDVADSVALPAMGASSGDFLCCSSSSSSSCC
jgi:thiazolylpeptide-type bacteriocin precursor